jgi:hypothetical protein
MAFTFEILRADVPADRSRWIAACDELPPERGDVYFRPQYLEALSAIGRGRATCAIARHDGALWLHPFLQSPIAGFDEIAPRLTDVQSSYGYGGPVVNGAGESAAFLDEAWRRFGAWSKSVGVVAEFIRFHPLLDNQRWAPPGMTVTRNRTTVVVDAGTYPEAVWNDPYFRVQRHMVRRAEREGYQFGVAPFDGDLKWFSSMYDETQARLQGNAETRFDETYFNAIRDGFGEDAWLGTVTANGEIAVAVLVLSSARFGHCHLMGYRRGKLTNGMTNLVYHGIYLEAARRGLALVHMGGGATGAADDALLKFKKSLSPETREFSIGMLVRDEEAYGAIERAWLDRGKKRPPGFFMFYRLDEPAVTGPREVPAIPGNASDDERR